MDDEQRITLETLKTGANWTAQAAYHTGTSESKACPLCTCETQNADHIWYCDALKSKRLEYDETLAAINPDTLPNPVKVGIAPALTADPRQFYWGNTVVGETLTSEENTRCCPCLRHDFTGTTTDDTIKKLCGKNGGHLDSDLEQLIWQHTDKIYARQVMSSFHKTTERVELLPNTIDQPPPQTPNVFTDGSVKNSEYLPWRTGGVGCFWPERDKQTMPANTSEETYTTTCFDEEGMKMTMPYTTYGVSSTRCETAVVIIALLPDTPVHIASDNNTTVTKMTQIITQHRDKTHAELHNHRGGIKIGGRGLWRRAFRRIQASCS